MTEMSRVHEWRAGWRSNEWSTLWGKWVLKQQSPTGVWEKAWFFFFLKKEKRWRQEGRVRKRCTHPEEQKWVSYRQGERHRDGSDAWVCGTISSKTLKLVESSPTEAADVVQGGRKKVHLVSPAWFRFTFVVLRRSVMNLSVIHQRGKTRQRCLG